MTCMRYSMLLFSVLELLLFGCTAGLSRAAHRESDESASQGSRFPRAALDEPLDATTIPNHLQEDDRNPRFTTFNPRLTVTTRDSRTSGKSNQLESFLVTATAAPLTKTMDPVNEISTLSTKLNITVNSTSFTPISHKETSTLPALDTNSSWTVKSTFTPVLTTETGPLQCNCSVKGSKNPDTCDPITCLCLPEYTGQQCDKCQDGYFSNGTSVCQACGCNLNGSVSQVCNSSGVCMCKAGVHGDKCDDCSPGFTQLSSTGCQPCQCNNHSNSCHTILDENNEAVCNQCKPEYQGPYCAECSDGFYNADSICVTCDCSGNEDPRTSPKICDPGTGVCLNCINNSTGPHCELCADGFTGDALARNCTLTVVHTTPSTTTHRVHYTTMTSGPNVTTQFTTSALLTTLASSTPNTTAAAVTQLPWNQFNIIILAVIIIVVVALMAAVGGVYTYREYQNRKINAPFWTIELKEDNISFSSYHDSIPNVDVSGLLEDELSEMAGNGQLALSGSLYKV
ncbi:multiple epidermal growth factor-like domains protein 9 isoform X2 [Misgurnus anguillicaudatus]|uniref:multiple epidermal growth factor-like domains protein 9 isoform X2 n=1 Tax=Misgurnus anguillicaudatus TaxID=75329 RepID=UPI003CCFDA62